jgi:iron-sulfur cluster repair protein YtfE (RIC family)
VNAVPSGSCGNGLFPFAETGYLAQHTDAPERRMAHLDLSERTGLPDALRVLLAELPREDWPRHSNFGGMVEFWLQRHLMFREVLEKIEAETQARLDRGIDGRIYAQHLSRYGGFFLNQLHGHHQIEDTHYFPQLIRLDQRLEQGFDLLEADHGAMDGLLSQFADGANAILQAADDADARRATGAFHDRLVSFKALLDRHLVDEEEIIVPVILKTGFDG